ncbi:MAG: beta-propeller domain-containing protein [Microthrixaceae bacterium]|nr:beta-propeller domain-containing protein [Microthrixaceae bacterium]
MGVVEDLGTGEEVQSVRFLDDMAYVVTFRQTDPLYAIDLSDPTNPETLGALKITGFSQYLHPVGDGLLLGVGREATSEGTDTGFKASLFDVSDPANPLEVDKIVIPDANSLVADDPLAFTWDPEADQAIIPLERYGSMTGDLPVDGTGPVPGRCPNAVPRRTAWRSPPKPPSLLPRARWPWCWVWRETSSPSAPSCHTRADRSTRGGRRSCGPWWWTATCGRSARPE